MSLSSECCCRQPRGQLPIESNWKHVEGSGSGDWKHAEGSGSGDDEQASCGWLTEAGRPGAEALLLAFGREAVRAETSSAGQATALQPHGPVVAAHNRARGGAHSDLTRAAGQDKPREAALHRAAVPVRLRLQHRGGRGLLHELRMRHPRLRQSEHRRQCPVRPQRPDLLSWPSPRPCVAQRIEWAGVCVACHNWERCLGRGRCDSPSWRHGWRWCRRGSWQCGDQGRPAHGCGRWKPCQSGSPD
ncbi:hypothetical protein M758_2G133700 [Ceratodon purpureus]|nr:hypothetical protein M758_2G133700 [Ceratodon purpureus]